MSLLKGIFSRKEQPISSYSDFWNWFSKNEHTFFKVVKNNADIGNNFFEPLSSKLNELKDGYFFLTGMSNENVAELVITADGNVSDFVFVEELINEAPKLKDWKFTAFKPAMDIEDVTIEMAGYSFNKNNLFFYSNDFSEYPDEIDITIIHEEFNEENKSDIINGINIFLDNYLGEIDFATIIDNLTIVGKQGAEKDLIPIEKLKSYLVWRQKEFVEKYEGARHHTENDSYSSFEGKLKNDNPIIGIMNSDLLNWDRKASHPWFVILEFTYDKGPNGMPDPKTYQLLEDIENHLMLQLKDSEGYLNIGRETYDGTRKVYFACREFKRPSKVLHQTKSERTNQITFDYSIYKDKYWQTLKQFSIRH